MKNLKRIQDSFRFPGRFSISGSDKLRFEISRELDCRAGFGVVSRRIRVHQLIGTIRTKIAMNCQVAGPKALYSGELPIGQTARHSADSVIIRPNRPAKRQQDRLLIETFTSSRCSVLLV